MPLFALIMAMIAVPFGFLVGNRGAMTGIGVSLAIGISYKGLGNSVRKDRRCRPLVAHHGRMVA